MSHRRLIARYATLAVVSFPIHCVLAQDTGGSPAPQPQASQPVGQPDESGVPRSVMEDFLRGFDGDSEAMTRAIAATDEILRQNPNNAEAMAWRGSGMTASCGQAFASGNPQEGMRLWKEGIAGLNHAVELQGDNPVVRMVRGKTMLESSVYDPNPESKAKALKTAVEDLELALVLVNDPNERVPANESRMIAAWLSDGWERLGDKAKADKYKLMAGELLKKIQAEDAAHRPKDTTLLAIDSALLLREVEWVKPLVKDIRAGGRGDYTALDRAIAVVDARLEADAADASSRAWRGFLRTIRSSEWFAKGDIKEGSKQYGLGMQELDRAIADDPTVLDGRALKAVTLLNWARHEQGHDRIKERAASAASELDRFVRACVDAKTPLTGAAEIESRLMHAECEMLCREPGKSRAILAKLPGELTKEQGARRDELLARVKLLEEKKAELSPTGK